MTVKEILKRSKIAKKIVIHYRRIGYRRMVRSEGLPFNGDKILIRMVDFLLTECRVKQFVETGTYLGHTCRYIASHHPYLPITTVESNPDFYNASQIELQKYGNVKSILADSAVTVSKVVQDGIDGLPLFFLDAHWNDYLPLPDEIQCIGKYLNNAIIVIHDFQVPGKDYGFDVCKGQTIGMEMLAANIDKSKNYQVYFPNYTYEQAYSVLPKPNQQLRGYAIIFQGAREAVNRFAKSEYAISFTVV
jgi:predicted O-methyltransferase YrrM